MPAERGHIGCAEGGAEAEGLFIEAAFGPLVGGRQYAHFEFPMGGQAPHAVGGGDQQTEAFPNPFVDSSLKGSTIPLGGIVPDIERSNVRKQVSIAGAIRGSDR